VVLLELKGKGIERRVVKMEYHKGLSVFLEVEAKNAHALNLNESCGFRSYHSQGYYKCLNFYLGGIKFKKTLHHVSLPCHRF
jgi:ribosomal protein S18 acetylase RimI-like enzyme